MERRNIRPARIITAAIILVLIVAFFRLSRPQPTSFAFVTVDHPVDMWTTGSDKWAYFSLGEGTTKDLAAKARTDLVARGFVEDTSKAPWFHFEKNGQEVVICNHDEFAVNGLIGGGSQLVAQKPSPPPPGISHQWPCVLVKNGPGTEESMMIFQVKKLLHGW